MKLALTLGASCAALMLTASLASAQSIPLNGPAVTQAGGVLASAGNAANAVTSATNSGAAAVGAAAPYAKPTTAAEVYSARGLSSGVKETGVNVQKAGLTVNPMGVPKAAPQSVKTAAGVVSAVPSKATITPGTLNGTPAGAVGGALVTTGQVASLGANTHEVLARPVVQTAPAALPFTTSVTNNARAIGSGVKQTGVAIQKGGLAVNPQAGATAAAQAAAKAPATVTATLGNVGH